MKKLNELYDCNYDVLVRDIKTNSKDVEEGDLFVCIKGFTEDRHKYIKDAIDRGCSAVIVEKSGDYSIPFIKVKDTNKELSNLSKKFYDYKDDVKIIGVTGTDGKTTTSTIIKDMLDCAYIGTNGISYLDKEVSTNNTTPDINIIYKYLKEFSDNNIKYVSMECSSEGLLHNRLYGINFDIGIYTNISSDHMNIHKTLSNYIDCKLKMFKSIKKDGFAIINRDDRFSDKIIENCNCNVLTYGKSLESDLRIVNVDYNISYTDIDYCYNDILFSIRSCLKGEYNVYNLSAGILSLLCLGFSISEIEEKINLIKQVKGRFEVFNYKDRLIVLDYAHTENGLRSVLTFLNQVKKNNIITVVGSAGGRDKEKRKSMGEVVQSLSDKVIYTMDDPRYENVLDIISDLKDESLDNYLIEVDRSKAIDLAIKLSSSNDIILVAGKGRDNYMAIEDRKEKYSDYDVIIDLINR